MKWFVGIPKNIFPETPKRFFLNNSEKIFREIQKDFSKRFFGKNKKNFQDDSRVKYIKQTKRDSIRYRLEQQAYFPQENEGLVDIFKKTFLHYFLPYPPAPPLEDPRNIFPEDKNGSEKE